MGFIDKAKERVIEWLGVPDVTTIDQRVSEAYERGFYDGNDDPATGTFKAGGQGYRRRPLSDNYVREGKIDYGRALEAAWNLWQKSPIAKRVLTMKRDHIVGHSAAPSAEDEDAGEIVTAFWDDNKLDRRSSQFAMQLFGFGEQCYPAFVRQSDGRVRLGYIDPANIATIIKHPDNSLEDCAVVVERIGTSGIAEKFVYRIIRHDEGYVDEVQAVDATHDGLLVTAEQATREPWEAGMLAGLGLPDYAGSCFYFKVNAVSNQSRGMSDLLQVADWIDQADEVLFALADREQFAGYFSWDVELDTADDKARVRRTNEIRQTPPAKGSVNVHTSAETWKFVAPDLGQSGTVETFRAILGLILGGMGFPVHWFGYGDDASRATAAVQGDPTVKSLEHDQETVREMLLALCQFAIDQAVIAGTISQADDYGLELNLPQVTVRDISRIAASMASIVQAVATAQAQGWTSQQTAVNVWAKLLSELNIDIDPAEEMELAAAEQQQAELDAEQKRNDALKAMMAQTGQGPSANGQRPSGNGQAVPAGMNGADDNDQ